MPTEQILATLILSLVTNSLWTLLTSGFLEVKQMANSRKKLKKAVENDAILILNTRKDLARILKIWPNKLNAKQLEIIKSFLESPTAESIIRQIYAKIIFEDTNLKSNKELQKELEICLSLHLNMSRTVIRKFARSLFEVIIPPCEKVLNIAIRKDVLIAHDAKSAMRYRILLDAVNASKSNVGYLAHRAKLDIDSIRNFEEIYRQQIGDRFRQITIPHFDKAPRVNLDEIFVSPNFTYIPEKKGKDRILQKATLTEFMQALNRSVVLGDPGGGKSTLAQKICHELCINYDKRFVSGRLLTPILVVLREYSIQKKEKGVSIIQFMEREVTSKYQMSRSAPLGAFEYLLNNGHLIVIFDGLDELLDPSHRREVSQNIEAFCTLYPSTPILVTSRTVGYEQAPLDKERFATHTIAPFNKDQAQEYATKWFLNDPDLSDVEGRNRANCFVRESQIVSDLRSNPLMLALMCNLYKGTGFIPRNRPEVYKKCSEMLFERWDPSRGIKGMWKDLPFAEPKFLLSHLAHWIYSNDTLQSGITEEQLLKESTEVLHSRHFENLNEARKASDEFIGCCKGRAWVFTDVGTTKEGATLYKFTHKTFLEYFTAAYIVRHNCTAKKLWNLLASKIAKRTWDVVAQLAFQMLHEQVAGASDIILTYLLRAARSNRADRWSYLSFATRCLQFISVPPQIVRSITKSVVRYVLANAVSTSVGENKDIIPARGQSNDEMICTLLAASAECRNAIAEAFEKEIVRCTKGKGKQALCAVNLGLTFLEDSGFERYPTVDHDAIDHWGNLEKRIAKRLESKVKYFARRHFLAFMLYFHHYELSITKLLKWFSADYLFHNQRQAIFPNVGWYGIGKWVLEMSLSMQTKLPSIHVKLAEKILKIAADIGKSLLESKQPIFSAKVMPNPLSILKRESRWWIRTKGHKSIRVPISNQAVFGFLCLWAATSEAVGNPYMLSRRLKKERSTHMKIIGAIIQTRFGRLSYSTALNKVKKLRLKKANLKLIERWVKGEVNFVRKTRRMKKKTSKHGMRPK